MARDDSTWTERPTWNERWPGSWLAESSRQNDDLRTPARRLLLLLAYHINHPCFIPIEV
jgi:hypothetical protein